MNDFMRLLRTRIHENRAYLIARDRFRRIFAPGVESKRAADYWGSLGDFEAYFNAPDGAERSRWVAAQVQERGIRSLLELGTNSGRNLATVKRLHPDVKLRGIDVNARAIEFATKKTPGIDFAVADANQWGEAPRSWDAILTMSVIDHIPDESIEKLARHMAATAQYVICVELWDGGEGIRGTFKYSRDLRELFEPLGVKTLMWEVAPGQYDMGASPLWAYVGQTRGA